jgi:hypothetical protein
MILQNKNPGDQAGVLVLSLPKYLAPHQNSVNQDLENLLQDFAWGVSAPLTLTKINYVGWAGLGWAGVTISRVHLCASWIRRRPERFAIGGSHSED